MEPVANDETENTQTEDEGEADGSDNDTINDNDGGHTGEPQGNLNGPIDPECVDGLYTEVLPTPTADIESEIASYNSDEPKPFIDAVLEKRYPIGAYLVENGLEQGAAIGDCVEIFLQDPSTAYKVIDALSTVVHECAHFFDMSDFGSGTADYYITEDLEFSCTGGDKFEYGGNTFTRNKLLEDDYTSLRPECDSGQYSDCDFYANTYLTGQSGDQGFSMLMEEAVQYVNSLATGYAFYDFMQGSISERDGILTFLWYIERYLSLARTDYPETYTFLLENSCWREMILTVWGRAWLYLSLTDGLDSLGISDYEIKSLVMDADLLSEIQAVREAHGCN